jgi:hypothetical protein
MTAASRSLATALWEARFASGLLPQRYTTPRDTTGPPAVADRPVGRMKSKPVGTNQAKELTRACPRDAPSAERIGRCVRNVAPTGNVAGRSIPRAQRGVSSSIPIDFLVRRPTKAGPAFGKC